MSFLTSEEASGPGLGQPWYGEPNVVAGMGGVLSMQELTSVKNYYQDPPDFPASVGLGALPTLVDSVTPRRRRLGHVTQAQRREVLARRQQAQSLRKRQALNSPIPRRDFPRGEIRPMNVAEPRLPISDMAPGEYQGHLNDWIPAKPSPNMVTQGTWLSPSQVPGADLESGSKLASEPQNFKGLGQAGQGTWMAPSQIAKGQRGTATSLVDHPQSFSLGSLGQPTEAQLNLQPICDPVTGSCIRYATPQEVRSAIGQKVGGESALFQKKVQLPSFYQHPQLGPWGVDPRMAYQYWWGQQAAMQQAAAQAPLPIWGSPGFVAPTPPLPASPIAQANAFNPYADSYPTAGAAVERF